MSQIPIRRAQLIAPFGVGAMVTGPDGSSMVTAALDAWFVPDPAHPDRLDLDEYRVDEWRLQEALQVNELRLPPDYRTFGPKGGEVKNLWLKVPLLRFPLWHFCRRCRTLQALSAHHGNRQRCAECDAHFRGEGSTRKAPFLAQVPFIAMCDHGHLQDFPWREWVHRDPNPTCDGRLTLTATGGTSLGAQKVQCTCGVEPRTLAGITETDGPDTVLSKSLAPGHRYGCRGLRPWMDDRIGEGCDRPLRGSLRAATNVYFGHVESTIFLPGRTLGVPEELIDVLTNPPLRDFISWARQLQGTPSAAVLKQSAHGHLLDRFPDIVVDAALAALDGNREDAKAARGPGDEVDPQALRRPEYEVLAAPSDTKDLIIRPQEPALYSEPINGSFSLVNLVDRLRETRALYGFSRILPGGVGTLSGRRRMLWWQEPDYQRSWLPAYVVRGEGLFFQFDEKKVSEWEQRPEVAERVHHLAALPERVSLHRGMADPATVPRFVLLHTFAHLMINELVFECGYSSASLRERLYCSRGDKPMAGVLLYTAAGDSEGTMGGLVRMGRPGFLEPVVTAALDKAGWCSSDPVCMELGEGGQGPGGANLAACHSCALLPETACEAFNRFLDRGLVVGTAGRASVGFFDHVSA